MAELERLIAEGRELTELTQAQVLGWQAELTALRQTLSEAAPPSGLGGMTASDAIVQVLRQAEGALTATQIGKALAAAGRQDHARSLNGLLSYLVRDKRIQRVGRAHYGSL